MNLKQRRGHIYDADNPLNDESGDVKRPFKTSDIMALIDESISEAKMHKVFVGPNGVPGEQDCSCGLCEAVEQMINRTWRE